MSSEEENDCVYVGSRGLLKSCACKSFTPVSSLRQIINQFFTNLKDGDSIYVCSSALQDFAENYLDKIRTKFVLVTGDSDAAIPVQALTESAFHRLIGSEFVIAWFSQNLVFSPKQYPKLRHLPIGLDYHTLASQNHSWGPRSSPKTQEDLLFAVAKKAKPFYERPKKAYTTFHFELGRGGRQQAYNQIPRELIHYEPEKTTRLVSWKNQSNYAFVASPPGEGLDCHRTWEALCLGCIPILLSTPLDDMFEDLPVLIVKSWTDVTLDLLENTVEEYKTREFRMEKLTMEYWVQQIAASLVFTERSTKEIVK